MKHLLLPAFAVLLSSCIDPYMMNMGPAPYGDPYRSQYRQDMRDQGREMNQMAYERGWQDGQLMRVKSRRGEIVLPVATSDEVKPGQAFVAVGNTLYGQTPGRGSPVKYTGAGWVT